MPILLTLMVCIGFLFFGSLLGGICTFGVGFAGAPGALIAAIGYKRDSQAAYLVGLVMAILGQSYVALAYMAMMVSGTKLLIAGNPNLYTWPVWVFAWYAAGAPTHFAMKDAATRESTDPMNPQDMAIGFTEVLVNIVFFVFVFAPSVMFAAWWWMPFVGTFQRFLSAQPAS